MPKSPIQESAAFFDLDDDDGWEDMPVVRDSDEFASSAGGLDEEDQKKYHYQPQSKRDDSTRGGGNATGEHLDVDAFGQEWRANVGPGNESEYTRLRVREEEDADEVHLRTRYLFDEDKAMTPLSQMQQTKNMLTEAQRIAYVGLCSLTTKAMADVLRKVKSKDLKPCVQSMELWGLKILGRLYYHMELATEEQKMIENLALHGVVASDLSPALMTTHTVANPEYDPAEARRQEQIRQKQEEDMFAAQSDDMSETTLVEPSTPTHPGTPKTPKTPGIPGTADPTKLGFQTTARILEETTASQIPGVSTTLSSADENVTLDIRWTVLCDLFLILIADSVYDARSRVLLEQVALHLGLGWLDVVKFEQRVTEALEIQEGVDKMEQQEIIDGRVKSSRKRRYMMMGLATLGGGLVIGLSAGLLAPVIGAGLGVALTTVGIGGTAGFLGGTAGAAVITTGGVLAGANIAGRGMARRTQTVRTFEILPLHNNKRVNAILTVPGFLTGELDDPRLPFSVLDPIVGDVYSVLWEPEMIRETGGALKILTSEVLSQIGQTVLQATVMTALMSALQWPIILTKLGYLIDNPWSNALDRAKAAGAVLADVLIHRHLGVRPITLIGYSLGGRLIFYCLLELARQKAYGIVQDVIILGTTVTAPTKSWLQVRSVVSGRFINGFARNDWLLNYLFRATNAGLATVAGLRPVDNVPGLENVDVTDKISGHMSYRTFMPLILDQLGFPVSADYFDEPEEPDFEGERIVLREGEELSKKKGWFGRKKSNSKSVSSTSHVSRPPTAYTPPPRSRSTSGQTMSASTDTDDDLPPREVVSPPPGAQSVKLSEETAPEASDDITDDAELPAPRAGFDLEAMKAIIETSGVGGGADDFVPQSLVMPSPSSRAQSAPPPQPGGDDELTPTREDAPPLAGPSTAQLTATLSRSLSVNDVGARAEEDADEDVAGATSSALASHVVGFASPISASAFDDEASAWVPPVPPEKDGIFRRGAFGGSSRSAFGGGGGLAFGDASGSISSFTSAANPSTASLSFGDASGAITSTTNVEPDPWAFGGERKATPSYLSNPWSS